VPTGACANAAPAKKTDVMARIVLMDKEGSRWTDG
jgi:hypothetical protein